MLQHRCCNAANLYELVVRGKLSSLQAWVNKVVLMGPDGRKVIQLGHVVWRKTYIKLPNGHRQRNLLCLNMSEA